MHFLRRSLASLSLASFLLNPLSAYAAMIPPGDAVNIPTLLSASDYGITEPAVELPAERTLRTATFDLGNGKRAQVSVSQDLFTHNPHQPDSIVFANSKGVQQGNSFVFDYLPQDTRVSFDLTKPSYTLNKGEHSFTLAFATNSSIQGTILNDHQISYPLSESATLVWTVDGTNVKKEIHVKNTGTNPTFPFSITSSLTKSLQNNSIILSDGSKQIFQTEKPYLLTTNHYPLLNSISLIENSSGNFEYVYDESALPSEYILDPDTGATNPGTVTSSGSGNAWDNPSNATTSDNTRTSVSQQGTMQYLNATNFGFSVSGTIDGIVVGIERKYTGNVTPVTDGTVQLIDGSGLIGSNLADTGTQIPSSDTVKTYGSSSNTWGATLDASAVNASSFGVAYQPLCGDSGCFFNAATIDVDHIAMTVYYTASGAANGTSCSADNECSSNVCYAGYCNAVDATVYYISGTLYSDEGSTTVSGKTVKAAIGGTVNSFTTTTAGDGTFTIPIGTNYGGFSLSDGALATIWVDGDSNNAVTVVKANGTDGTFGSSVTGASLYYNRLLLQNKSSGTMTSANLQTASVSSDADVTDIFSMSSNNLTMGAGTTLFIKSGTTFAPTANVDLVNFKNPGTTTLANLSTSTFTVSGNFNSPGTFTPSNKTVTLDGSSQTVTGNSGNLTFYNLTKTNGGGSTLTIDGNGGAVIVQSSLTLSGTNAGSLMTVADVGSTIFRLTSGGSQSLSYLSVANMNATGGDTLNCGTNCTDGDGNTNWTFISGGGGGGGDVPSFSTIGLLILLGGCYMMVKKNELAEG